MVRLTFRVVLVVFPSVSILIGYMGYLLWDGYHSKGPLQVTVTVVIPEGISVRKIAKKLKQKGVISDEFFFLVGSKYYKLARRMRAGEFEFQPYISMKDTAQKLAVGNTVKRRLVIPEGLLSKEIGALVSSTPGLVGKTPKNLREGNFLPDTYFFSLGDTRESILLRMKMAMKKAVSEAWASRSSNIAIGTPRDALILASIIEKETGLAGERARVSAVFHNRIRLKMRLQSDPTVVYAVTSGKRILRRKLKRSDLQTPSLYNTYRRKGLPPAPISNPGRASIFAAVTPSFSKDLYFVADGEGGHVFSKTLREHNLNVLKWRRKIRQ
tara:strand:+ start:330 stop:1307 length:978 start_codon:yes stop_codon:yes gene_type:complete